MGTTDWIMITYWVVLWLTCQSIVRVKGQNIGTTYSIRNYHGPHEPLNDATRYSQQEYIQQYYPALSSVQAQPNQQPEYQAYSSAQYPGYEQQGLALTYASPLTQSGYGSSYQAPVYSNQQTQDGQLPQSNYYVQGRNGNNPFLGTTYYPAQSANAGYYQPQGSSNSYGIQAPSALYQGVGQGAYGQVYSAQPQLGGLSQGQVSGSLQGQPSRITIPNPFLSQNSGQQIQSQQSQATQEKSPYLQFNVQRAQQQQQQQQFHPTMEQLQQRQQLGQQPQQQQFSIQQQGPLHVQQQLDQFQQQQQQQQQPQQQQEQLEQHQQQPRQEQLLQQLQEQEAAQHPVQDPGDTEALIDASGTQEPSSPQAQGDTQEDIQEEELPQGPSLEGPPGEMLDQLQGESVRGTGPDPVEGQDDKAEQDELPAMGNTGEVNEEGVRETKEQQHVGGKVDKQNIKDTEAAAIVNQNSQNGEVEQGVDGRDEEESAGSGHPSFAENKDSVIDAPDAEESDEPEVAEHSDEENDKGNNREQNAPGLSTVNPLEVIATTPEPAEPKTDTERPVVRERTTHRSFHGLFRARNKGLQAGIRSFRRRASMWKYPGRTTPSGTRYYHQVKGYHPLNRFSTNKGKEDSPKIPKDAHILDNEQTEVSESDLQRKLDLVPSPIPTLMPEESAAVETDSEMEPTEQPPLNTLLQPQDGLSESDQELRLPPPSPSRPESLDEVQESETDPVVPSDQESLSIKSESQEVLGQSEDQLPQIERVLPPLEQQQQQGSLQEEEPLTKTTTETIPEQQQQSYKQDESEEQVANSHSWDTESQPGPISTPNSVTTQANNTLLDPEGEGSHKEMEITHSTIPPVQHRDKEIPTSENQNEENKESLNHVVEDVSLKPSEIQQGAEDYVQSGDEQRENQQSTTISDTEIAVSGDVGTTDPTTITIPPTTSRNGDQKSTILSYAEMATSEEIGSTASTTTTAPPVTNSNDESMGKAASNDHEKKMILNTTDVPILLTTTDVPISLTTRDVQTKAPVSHSSMMEQTDHQGVNTLASHSNREPTISSEVPLLPQVINRNVMEEGKGNLVQSLAETQQSTLATPHAEMRVNLSKGTPLKEPKGSSTKEEPVQAQPAAETLDSQRHRSDSEQLRNVTADNQQTDPANNTQSDIPPSSEDALGSTENLRKALSALRAFFPVLTSPSYRADSSSIGDEALQGEGSGLDEAEGAMALILAPIPKMMSRKDPLPRPKKPSPSGNLRNKAALTPHNQGTAAASPSHNQGTKSASSSSSQSTKSALPNKKQGTMAASHAKVGRGGFMQWPRQEQARLGLSLLDRLLQAGGATMIRVDLGQNRKGKSHLPMLASFLGGTKKRRGVIKTAEGSRV